MIHVYIRISDVDQNHHIRRTPGVKKIRSPFWADWGRFPLNKNSGLNFRTFRVPNVTVTWALIKGHAQLPKENDGSSGMRFEA